MSDYIYVLNDEGKAQIKAFLKQHGLPNLNLEAYYAAAEVDGDRFHERHAHLPRLILEPLCSVDQLEHELILEPHYYNKRPFDETEPEL